MRVLVIEDEADLRSQLQTQLRRAGYAVDIAADGTEGYYFGKEYPIDLAVVDLGLPDLSGIEVIRKWRADGGKFPILILTARGRWQDKVEGLEAGADDYLVKPFTPRNCWRASRPCCAARPVSPSPRFVAVRFCSIPPPRQ